MKGTIYVIGGDLRQITVAGLLKEEGFDVYTIGLTEEDTGLDGLCAADCVVLPIPASCDNIYINAPLAKTRISVSEVLDNIPSG